jgi:hypothetical protein
VATGEAADHAAGNTVFVLHRGLVLHGHVVAALLRRQDGGRHVLHCQHLGLARCSDGLVAADRASAQHDHGDTTDDEALGH